LAQPGAEHIITVTAGSGLADDDDAELEDGVRSFGPFIFRSTF